MAVPKLSKGSTGRSAGEVDIPDSSIPTVKAPPTVEAPQVTKTPTRADTVNNKSEADIKKSVEGQTLDGKNVDELAKDPEVVKAAAKNSDNLKSLGIKAGLFATGLAALMILYGEPNPLEAIRKAMKDAGKTAKDTAAAGASGIGNFFKGILSSLGGVFNISAIFASISCLMIVLWLIVSLVLKK